jgi:hypothetical protein
VCHSVSLWRTKRDPAAVGVRRCSALTSDMRPRARDRATAARTCANNVGRTAWEQPALTPARASVDEPTARDLLMGSGRLDQALSTSALATLEARQRGMARQLDRILARDLGVRQEPPSFFWRTNVGTQPHRGAVQRDAY